jgi:protein-tyrosine phosphatase
MASQVWSRQISTILKHPTVKRVRRAARDVGSWVDAYRIKNPAIRSGVKSVLFVCLGNICRSPFAERLAKRRFERSGIVFASAGITAKQSNRCPDEAHAAAELYQISLAQHQPMRLSREVVDAFEVIIAMEAAQVERLREEYPHAVDRIILLSLFDAEARGAERFSIDDPFMCPLSEFVACFNRIDRSLSGLAYFLSPARGAAPAEHA